MVTLLAPLNGLSFRLGHHIDENLATSFRASTTNKFFVNLVSLEVRSCRPLAALFFSPPVYHVALPTLGVTGQFLCFIRCAWNEAESHDCVGWVAYWFHRRKSVRKGSHRNLLERPFNLCSSECFTCFVDHGPGGPLFCGSFESSPPTFLLW